MLPKPKRRKKHSEIEEESVGFSRKEEYKKGKRERERVRKMKGIPKKMTSISRYCCFLKRGLTLSRVGQRTQRLFVSHVWGVLFVFPHNNNSQ